MKIETNIDQLQPGMFIKTIGARDRVGLRKIVEVGPVGRYSGRHELLVDHYSLLHFVTDGKKHYMVRRKPYSSEVLADKVRFIYEVDEQHLVKGRRKFSYYKG